ncbi:hypothetical protein D5018_10805 [Parashewanella curva]|uniref:DoxX family membrane protein n=1 Tax=Parashewanella curva TaxID=2338552 RepID=A0A3L8PW18_9GAMM|nr:hypothetical protein [Parashewanella curva]RLV59637.1 hypothetical protein D5018_10805 [Parashewanella curva]
MRQNSTEKLATIFAVILGIIYFTAGISKFFHWFPHIIGPIWLIDALAKYNLALFGYFIALSQTIVGALLLTYRFRLIGALMLLPMHLCILIIPISLGWQGTPYVNAVLLSMLMLVIYADKNKLSGLVRSSENETTEVPFIRNFAFKSYSISFIAVTALAVLLKYGHLLFA